MFKFINSVLFASILCACSANVARINISYAEYSHKVEDPPLFFGSNPNVCQGNEVFIHKWLIKLNKNQKRERKYVRTVCSKNGYKYYIYETALIEDRYVVVVTKNDKKAISIFNYSNA